MKCPKCKKTVSSANFNTILDNKGNVDLNLLQVTLRPCGHRFKRNDDPATYNQLTEEVQQIAEGKIGAKRK